MCFFVGIEYEMSRTYLRRLARLSSNKKNNVFGENNILFYLVESPFFRTFTSLNWEYIYSKRVIQGGLFLSPNLIVNTSFYKTNPVCIGMLS